MSGMFSYEDNSATKTALSLYNVFVHILMGVIVGIPLLFAVLMDFKETSAPSDILMIHVVLCVLGVSYSIVVLIRVI